ncbi:MAG: signal peptidase I [Eubacterium sp.]|nr:signal peptidase I [Eubacterium sp.]
MDEKIENKVDDGTTSKKKCKRTATTFMISFFIKIGVTAVVVAFLLVFVFGIYVKHDNSSYPMIKDGDLCITYKLSDIKDGDEIAYKKDGKIRFGRVVALPGDTVDVNDGNLAVNGYAAFENAVYPTTVEGIPIKLPYRVPEGTYFVLNDYRDDITDSRTYGGIGKSDIKGKVIFLLRIRGF